MSADIVIKTENLTKIYSDFFGRKKFKALDNLNLEVYRGEVFGLLGPNGSGKTTTMKLLLGLIFPTSGHAWVLGKEPTHILIKERIGFLPEESYHYKFLTGEETLDFYGKLFGLSKSARQKKVDELLSLFGMKEASNRKIGEYSKGMARRIGFAQALLNDPEVIFLDEPTSGLDPIMSRQIKDLVLELKKRGKTIFLSSHLLADVEDVCDRIAILHEGKLRKIGLVKDMLKKKEEVLVKFKALNQNDTNNFIEIAKKSNIEILDITNPSHTLEQLFLKTILEDDKKEQKENESKS